VLTQLQGIAFVAVFSPLATAAILGVLRLAFGSLRVSDEEEIDGLDLSQHSESAYGLAGGGVVPEAVGSGALGLGVIERQSRPA
jgi:ammonia channel protein AmtB